MTRSHFLPGSSDRRKKNKTCTPYTTTDKTKRGMVNSVVKGVSKLSLCKGPPLHEDPFQDDGSQTNETASTSRSGTLDFSPLHVAVPCSGRPPVCVPTPPTQIQDAQRRYSDTTLLRRWSEEPFASGPAYLPENNIDDDEIGILDDDPPLSSQTNYAREQLLKCNGYREMLKKSQQKKLQQEQKLQRQQQQQQQQSPPPPAEEEFDDYDCDDDEDDDLCCDEVEISRGLGGYEEGFGVPTVKAHAYHHLPLAIDEEQEEEEEDWSVASSDFEPFRCHSKSSSTKATATTTTTLSNGRLETACIHCLNGTCENEDCSGSRFMI
jgi:hypothetical protein